MAKKKKRSLPTPQRVKANLKKASEKVLEHRSKLLREARLLDKWLILERRYQRRWDELTGKVIRPVKSNEVPPPRQIITEE